jgi:hypothetical protein
MKYTVKITSDCMTSVPIFMKTGLETDIILRLLPHQFESQQCFSYWQEDVMMYTVEIASGGMICELRAKFYEDLYRRSSNIKVLTQQFERL